ncbi:MAG: DUF2203 domain-containing protein [Gemmatales bacterium]|nr:DUF2203 domain-containing protein [Gemmatales bacterium]MCS7159962.1 DUF2203 domain-containing protein [Gemmatales bacterium]MDW8175161.1 DUF2203 domain-containing protein [Gemmatales bacterium]MDW8222055.1 DUF2203 domain-containing protein [Gemmatales bacterium]
MPVRSFRYQKHFTVEQANRMLPLVKAIVQDICALGAEIQQRQHRLAHLENERQSACDAEERERLVDQLDRDAAQLEEYLRELHGLGVEFKGWEGLVDFPALLHGREVFLCWKLGEPEVAHWHDLDAGFAGRRKLQLPTSS